ncbi:1069_t:CDS:2 [Dentiscutata heterogama]|uniref:1069_t:CDS:1 n=1 Tax=Dentiscutata heterogama TaxID=1316150 RepID=A0ACA9LND2_9GLOM|nr:1069_t:CDS:2 [Dentiscutata heterogama]
MDKCLIDQQIQNSQMFEDLRDDHNLAMTMLRSEEEEILSLQKQIKELKSKKEYWKKIVAEANRLTTTAR